MKIKYYLLMILVLSLTFNACKSDDDGDGGDPIVEEDRGEQQIKDNDSLIDYLETHYYNSSAFVLNADPSIADLIINKLPEDGILPDPDNNTLLIDAVETKATVFAETDYQYYILKLNQGGGDSPTFAHTVRVNYQGFTLDKDLNQIAEAFDSAVTPVDFDLTTLPSGGVIQGWRKAIPEFNATETFVENGDGTIDFMNHGVGVMFLPSGLAYFSGTLSDIPAYSPLIFKFELFQTFENDHDNDGIPSYFEDLDNNEDITDDDTDEDFAPNYLDLDDDGDGVATMNELEPNEHTFNPSLGEQEPILGVKEFMVSRSEDDGVITIKTVIIKDSNNDGLDDYLDENITINYNEEG